jgi:DNA-binding NtrC family response regulator
LSIRRAITAIPALEDPFGRRRDLSEKIAESVERRHILDVLDSLDGDKIEAAKVLGIDLSTLYRKLKKYEEENVSSIGVRL